MARWSIRGGITQLAVEGTDELCRYPQTSRARTPQVGNEGVSPISDEAPCFFAERLSAGGASGVRHPQHPGIADGASVDRLEERLCSRAPASCITLVAMHASVCGVSGAGLDAVAPRFT